MLFSSPIFIFLFLPLVLLVYYISPKVIKNYWLLFASLVFFAWGGVSNTVIIIASIIINYIIGLLIEKHRGTKKSYWWAFAGVSINILTLGIFKYANFITHNLNLLFTGFHFSEVPETSIALPIGISFYTFHLLSYLIDIYKGKTSAQKNIFRLALYVCMFSQLIAGPIIRYADVWQQLGNRFHLPSKFAEGIERFIIGLAKKVILANTFAYAVDQTLGSGSGEGIGAYNALLCIVCYTFQIYCDFSGYSDMAIGLGKLFGFDFQENFNFPYLATSVKDFWRRWHISLSSFFRDYVYIPLGGNRSGKVKVYINLFLVFLLTGFWHGASWSFVVWGLFHGLFLIIERLGFEKILMRLWRPFSMAYTLIVVMMAWVLFRIEDIEKAVGFWQEFGDFSSKPNQMAQLMRLLDLQLIITLIVTCFGAFGGFKWLNKLFVPRIQSITFLRTISEGASILVYTAILLLCTQYLISGTYNPFIYYKF